MEKLRKKVKQELERDGLPYDPSKEYRLVQPRYVATRKSQGWKSVSEYNQDPEQVFVIMEKDNGTE